MQENSYFGKALANFTREAAYAAAVRHLAEEEYSLRDILDTLTYPAPEEAVRRIAFEHLLKTGYLLEEEPESSVREADEEFVLEEGKYGKKSYRRVVKDKGGDTFSSEDYFPCDFGLLDEEKLSRILESLPGTEREFLEGIPWKRKRMYIKKTPKTKEIFRHLKAGTD
ncbi:MAG: hypothetical protein K6F53_07700 [Lachnospiraceae bacterium]|nr:hypothetical protein [Lachnospiraceae bacterium]